MNNYEVMFIIESALDEEKKQATIEMVKEVISTDGGEITKENIWGNRKLAYPINKKNDGYYVVMEFTAKPELPSELDRRLKISDAVIRHIIINKDEK